MKIVLRELSHDEAYNIVKELIDVDFDKGILWWKKRTMKWFMHCKFPHRDVSKWNSTNMGNLAFNCIDSKGYKYGCIMNNLQRAHQMVYLLYHKRMPTIIDHMNGDKLDNSIHNIREVSREINMRNTKMFSTNKTGYTGVSWCNRDKVYRATIQINRKTKHLGNFNNKEDAYKARKEAERIIGGFTERHGT